MREILFRGKTKDEANEWVESCNINTQYDMNGKKHIYIGLHTESKLYPLQKNIYWLEVIPETVGQFTGLTDKNGKKIFEGDIVKFTDTTFGYSYIGFVCFYNGSFCIKYKFYNQDKLHRIGQTDKWQDMGASGIITYEYEVLGNVFDNPELLEVENEQ